MRIPKAIQNAPELTLGLQLFYMGYQDLSRGQGQDSITWSTIQDYSERIGLDKSQTEDMHYHITNLDSVKRDWLSKKEGKSGAISKSVR